MTINHTHNQLIDDLAAHLRGTTNRLVWTDMQLGPAGSPRPDLFTLDKSYSKFLPLAYEIKVTLSDFRRDITAGKWQSYLKYASGVYFAVPQGLVSRDDIPPGCGLIVRTETGWRSLRKPTLQHKESLPHAAWMKLVLDGCDRSATDLRLRSGSTYRANREIQRKFGERVAAALSDRDRAESNLKQEQAILESRLQDLRDSHEKNRLKLIDEIRREDAIGVRAHTELATALGLSPDADVYTIRQAAHSAARRLDANSEIAALRNVLSRTKIALDDALRRDPLLSMEQE
ncbi:MmcB family DNA repair protein [Candidatus Methylospira mobilis]|uniref:MmcB family DNA repair protein n=1 Tax=Candidatus Methylospira mobilis TaxID=1808979 RepID=A0A5Q0BL96_9GAMM|nr:MmcB family DNA repair protein [Candidatus Methylospira mobilis]QFY42971.1 MmcB family DNA repair protein [Candidatus Methylospira mobilis]